jgi:hypothetical protein
MTGPMSNFAAAEQLVETVPYRMRPRKGKGRRPGAADNLVDTEAVYAFAQEFREKNPSRPANHTPRRGNRRPRRAAAISGPTVCPRWRVGIEDGKVTSFAEGQPVLRGRPLWARQPGGPLASGAAATPPGDRRDAWADARTRHASIRTCRGADACTLP